MKRNKIRSLALGLVGVWALWAASAHAATQLDINTSMILNPTLMVYDWSGRAINQNAAIWVDGNAQSTVYLERIFIATTDRTKGVMVTATPTISAGNVPIPLIITLNHTVLPPGVGTMFPPAVLFPGVYDGAGNSITMPFTIAVDTAAMPNLPSGTWQGTLVLAMSQST